MQKEFELSLQVINDVLDNGTTFAEALRKIFQADASVRPLRGQVAGLAGCELRHQIYFDYMTKGLEGFDVEKRRLLSLALANAYFYRRFDVDESKKVLAEKLSPEEMEKVQYLFDLAATPENYVPTEVDRKSPLYLSLRFNVPEWAVKIIAHFGGSAAYQSLRKFSRPASTTLRVRTSALSLSSVFEKPEFSSTPVNGIVFYKGNVPLRKLPEFQKGLLFAEKMLTKSILDAHPVSDPGQILLYNGNPDSSLEREIIESYGEHVGINIAVPNVDERVEVTRLIKDKGLHNVNFFSAPDPLNMEASISAPQQLVVASPNSTNFDLIPNSPDYLLHFDTQMMDAILDQEKKVLEGAAKYVAEGGTLLYVVYTISKKEGRLTISEFLKNHREFRLVEEKQHFPYEELETAAYVAELVKGPAELTIPPAFSDLASIQNPAPTTAAPTASGK